jgi:hypothetical protein
MLPADHPAPSSALAVLSLSHLYSRICSRLDASSSQALRVCCSLTAKAQGACVQTLRVSADSVLAAASLMKRGACPLELHLFVDNAGCSQEQGSITLDSLRCQQASR